MQARNISVDLRWVPKLQNEEADVLTNTDLSAFDERRRIDRKVEDMPLGIRPRMLEVEVGFTQGRAETKDMMRKA